MKLNEADCRLEGFRAGKTACSRATHLPTGTVLEIVGKLRPSEMLRRLEKAVDELAVARGSKE